MNLCESCYIFREIAESCLAWQTDDLHSALKVNGAQENGNVIIWVSEMPRDSQYLSLQFAWSHLGEECSGDDEIYLEFLCPFAKEAPFYLEPSEVYKER